MAGRDNEQPIEKRSIGREIGQALIKELGFALNSARQDVLERGWFGERVTPQIFDDLRRDYSRDVEIFGGQENSRDNVYGRDPEPLVQEPTASEINWESVRNVADEAADKSRQPFEVGSDARWESHKDLAEQLYGPEGRGALSTENQFELADLYGPDDIGYDDDAAIFGDVPGVARDHDQERER